MGGKLIDREAGDGSRCIYDLQYYFCFLNSSHLSLPTKCDVTESRNNASFIFHHPVTRREQNTKSTQ